MDDFKKKQLQEFFTLLEDDSVSVDILNRLNNLIQQLSPEDIKTHAYLQDAEFVAQLNKLMRDASLTR